MRQTQRAMLLVGAAAAVLGAQALHAHATGPSSMSTGKIQEFSTAMPPQGTNTTEDITQGSDGNMWVVNTRSSSISRITPTGQTTVFPVTPASGLMVGITSGPDGALWFTTYEGTIDRMTTNGVVTNVYQVTTSPWQGAITSGPDGALWFGGLNAAIGRLTTTGVVSTMPVQYGVGDLTTGPDGNIWFTVPIDGFTLANIGRVNPRTGDVAEFPVPPNINGHTSPSGITAGPDGNVWFSDYFDQIGKVTPAGVVTTYAVGQENPQPALPTDIVTGPDGGLWFTIQTFGVLGRMATDGTWQRFPLPYQYSQPGNIARGPHNTVWWTEGRPTVGYIKTCGASAGCTM